MDILFDIGNVIIGVDFLPSLKRLIPEGTKDAQAKLNRVLDRKDAFEAGKIPQDQYFSWAAETIEFAGSQEEFITAWLDIFSPNEPMWECISQLHFAGHRLLLFSNINNPHKDHLLTNYPIFEYFTGGIFSYQTGHIKPEDPIYQIAIAQYGLDPESTLYIDDLAANIEAGKQAGLQCHQYHMDHHEEFLTWLKDYR